MTTRCDDPGPPLAASNVAKDGVVVCDDDHGGCQDEDDGGIQLVARPPFVAATFARLDPNRFDRIRLYAKKKKKTQKTTTTAAAAATQQGSTVLESSGMSPTTPQLHQYDDDEPRYTVTVVDQDAASSTSNSVVQHNTVAFLIPAGREAEFMFGTSQGLHAVRESANCRRLIAIATGRNHTYAGGSSQIQQELSELCQILHYRGGTTTAISSNRTNPKSRSGRGQRGRRGTNSNGGDNREDEQQQSDQTRIPFVTTSEGVGDRQIVARGTSPLSGEYVVEQVRVEDEDEDDDGGDKQGTSSVVVTARRLYFLSNPFVIQSEVCYRNDVLDPSRVAFEYHRAMVACLAAATTTPTKPLPPDVTNRLEPQGLLLGLGGGGLLHYVHRVLPQLQWVAVELDPEVARIAERHFGLESLVRSGYVDIRIANGLDVRRHHVVTNDGDNDTAEPVVTADAPTNTTNGGPYPTSPDVTFAAGSLACIVMDVDSKDTSIGMSCPPPDFLKEEYLQLLASLLAAPEKDSGGGVLVVNVSARDATLLDRACHSIRSVFSHVFTLSPGDDSINVVVLASRHRLHFPGPEASAPSDASSVSPSLDGVDDVDLRRLVNDLRLWEPLINFADSELLIPPASTTDPRRNKKNNKKKGGKKKR